MAPQAAVAEPLAVAEAATRTLKVAAVATISAAVAALRVVATADLKFLTKIFPSSSCSATPAKS